MDWDKHWWFVIENIVQRSNVQNNLKSWNILNNLADYLPCQKCKVHFKDYLSREKTINQEWLSKLKNEIKVSKKKKNSCKSCRNRKNIKPKLLNFN